MSTLADALIASKLLAAGSQNVTVSGATVEINASKAGPASSVVAQIVPVQDLHGYDAPWPGGGGKNLLQTTGVAKTEAGVTWTPNADGSVTVSGVASGYTTFVVGYINVTGMTGILTVAFNRIEMLRIQFGDIVLYNSSSVMIAVLQPSSTDSSYQVNLDDYPGVASIAIVLKRAANGEVSGTAKVQVVAGTTIPAWSPYSNICPITGHDSVNITVKPPDASGTVYPVSFGAAGTVYGGTIDVVSGVLTVTMAGEDMGSYDWTYDNTSYSYGFFNSGNRPSKKAGVGKLLCSIYGQASGGRNTLTVNCTMAPYNISNSKVICVRNDAYNDPAAFKTAMAGVYVYFELATPLTYTLTGQEIDLLLGQNVIYADTGDISVSYQAESVPRGEWPFVMKALFDVDLPLATLFSKED